MLGDAKLAEVSFALLLHSCLELLASYFGRNDAGGFRAVSLTLLQNAEQSPFRSLIVSLPDACTPDFAIPVIPCPATLSFRQSLPLLPSRI
jgi:hypothetical protein